MFTPYLQGSDYRGLTNSTDSPNESLVTSPTLPVAILTLLFLSFYTFCEGSFLSPPLLLTHDYPATSS